MKKLVLSISLGLIAVAIASPVNAQSNAGGGSIKIDKKKLDKVEFYRSRPQIEILDESAIIKDRRTPNVEPDQIEFRLKPVGTQKGKTIIYEDPGTGGSGSPFSTSNPMVRTSGLAPAGSMFNSNIPGKPMVNTGSLPGGQSTGVHGPTGEAAMGKKAVNAKLTTASQNPGNGQAVVVKTYKDYKGGDSSVQVMRTNKLTGVLKTRLEKK